MNRLLAILSATAGICVVFVLIQFKYGQSAPQSVMIQEVPGWPKDKSMFDSFGPVAGLAISPENGHLYVFARRNIMFHPSMFDAKHNYLKRDDVIKEDAVIVIHPDSGHIIDSFGSNQFYLPHGMNIDSKGNIWMTDVALHQVVRYSKDNLHKPDLVLGEKFVPGKDDHHFCKPTDVVISSNGRVFISDGYCNSRVVIADSHGMVIDSFDVVKGDHPTDIPHSITLIEKEDLVCVADRELRRIPCFTAGFHGAKAGILKYDLKNHDMKRVFAVDHVGKIILAVNAAEQKGQRTIGVALDMESSGLLTRFQPRGGFHEPHDICVSKDKKTFFVADIHRNATQRIVKFIIDIL